MYFSRSLSSWPAQNPRDEQPRLRHAIGAIFAEWSMNGIFISQLKRLCVCVMQVVVCVGSFYTFSFIKLGDSEWRGTGVYVITIEAELIETIASRNRRAAQHLVEDDRVSLLLLAYRFPYGSRLLCVTSPLDPFFTQHAATSVLIVDSRSIPEHTKHKRELLCLWMMFRSSVCALFSYRLFSVPREPKCVC